MAESQWNEEVEDIDYEARINIQVSVLNQLDAQSANDPPVELSHDLWAEFDKYANLKNDDRIIAVKIVNEGKVAVYQLIALTRAMAELNSKSGEIDDATKTQQLLCFIKGCRLLLDEAKSKEEYETLTDEEKTQYSSLEQKTKWFEHISETAPIIERAIKKIHNTQLATNLTEMQTMLKNITPPELQVSENECIPVDRNITPGCKITRFEFDENSPNFLTLEISNVEATVVYRLEITTDYDKHVTISEWKHGDAEKATKVYKVFDVKSGSKFDKFGGCYQMNMYYRKSMLESYDPEYPEISHDCTKFVGAQVVDMASNYNTKSKEVNGRFVEKHMISHKFILGEVVGIDNHSGSLGNTLETFIEFEGVLMR